MKKISSVFLPLFFLLVSSTVVAQDEEFKKRHEALGKEYAFAMQGPGAALAAKTILDQGGNIFDAAIAASLSMSVERPQSTGIGGGGFMLLYSAKEKRTFAFDFRERAPLKAKENMFVNENGEVVPGKSSTGIFAVGVPGLIAGLIEVHQTFGKLPFEKLVQPAIDLAEKGSAVTKHIYDKLVSEKKTLLADPTIKEIFYQKDGTPLNVDDIFVQKDLAKSLREIQKNGRAGFYDGWISDAWIKTSQKYGGLLTKGDFDAYQVKRRAPVVGHYRGMKVFSMPPPSSGGIALIQILGILDSYKLQKYGRLSPTAIHLVSSAMQLAFLDRYMYLADPGFADVPTKSLISQKRIDQLRKEIPLDRAVPSQRAKDRNQSPFPKNNLPYESTETAHFSMMDSEGNVVSTTQSVNGYFGAGLIAQGTGIVMNNTMDDFTAKAGEKNAFGATGGEFNKPYPQKTPLSSMSPTIVFDDKGRPVMAVGTPDGPRIISCLAQTLINYFGFNMPLGESISALRYHHQWDPDEIRVDSPGFSSETTKSLEAMGHKVTPKDIYCKVQAVAAENGQLHAFSDLRGLESVSSGR